MEPNHAKLHGNSWCRADWIDLADPTALSRLWQPVAAMPQRHRRHGPHRFFTFGKIFAAHVTIPDHTGNLLVAAPRRHAWQTRSFGAVARHTGCYASAIICSQPD
jgi:hypothetical protein